MSFTLLVSGVAAIVLTGAVDPKQAADELRGRLLSQGRFKAVYEIAMPGRGKRTSLEITADLPRSCYMVLDSGSDKEVHIYADAPGRTLHVFGREKGRPTLLRTDGTGLIDAVNAVRAAFIKAGLGTETVLPGVSDGTGAAASEGLHMFVTISLGPTRDRRGRPYFRSGAGLAVGVVPACGSWLLDVANDDGSALTATEEAYRLVITPQGELAPASTPGRGSRTGAGDTGSGTDSGPKEAPPVLPRASTPGSEVTISRRTGLPTAARAERKPGETIILTLTNREPVTAFKAPPWVGKPPADARARDLALPPQQRRKAAYKAWTYYVARCTKYLAREPKWKEALEKKRKHMVVTLADQAEALWRVQGQGSGGEFAAPRGTSPAGFLSVLGGAYRETERRFLYVKETDPTKARAIARQYALEAIQRRDEMLKDALDKMIERFGQDVRREAARTGPAEAAVSAQLLTIVRDAVRASYVRRAPDLIAGQLMTRRSGTR